MLMKNAYYPCLSTRIFIQLSDGRCGTYWTTVTTSTDRGARAHANYAGCAGMRRQRVDFHGRLTEQSWMNSTFFFYSRWSASASFVMKWFIVCHLTLSLPVSISYRRVRIGELSYGYMFVLASVDFASTATNCFIPSALSRKVSKVVRQNVLIKCYTPCAIDKKSDNFCLGQAFLMESAAALGQRIFLNLHGRRQEIVILHLIRNDPLNRWGHQKCGSGFGGKVFEGTHILAGICVPSQAAIIIDFY